MTLVVVGIMLCSCRCFKREVICPMQSGFPVVVLPQVASASFPSTPRHLGQGVRTLLGLGGTKCLVVHAQSHVTSVKCIPELPCRCRARWMPMGSGATRCWMRWVGAIHHQAGGSQLSCHVAQGQQIWPCEADVLDIRGFST